MLTPSSTGRKHPLAECERCPWQETKGVAYGVGPEDAEVIIIGEAPGQNEVQTGEPFTGPSGKLLDTVLAHHGIDRNDVFVTNAVLCHPGFTGGAKAPPKEAINACFPRLKGEITTHPTKTILALGNTASQAILNTRTGVTTLRQGPPKDSMMFPGIKVIPTVHPAACLRQSDMFPSLVKDVGKVKDSDIWIKWEEPRFKIFDEPDVAIKALQEIRRRYKFVGVDIEVGVDKDSSFSHPGELLCVGLSYKPNTAVVVGEKALQDPAVRRELGQLLESCDILCQNGKFDIQVLIRMGIIVDPYMLKADTMLASYCLDERPGQHGLEVMAMEILGAPPWKSELDRYRSKDDSYAVVPRPVLYKYNAYDAALMFNLWTHFEARLKKEGFKDLHDRLVGYSHELIYVELEGVHFDMDYNAMLLERFDDLLVPVEQQMIDLLNHPFNPRSPKQIKEVLHEMGIRVLDTQEDTLRSLLERVQGESANFINALLLHRKHQKSYSTYVKGMRKRVEHGRIYSTFTLHNTVTGRTSSRNPNLQNITRVTPEQRETGLILRAQFVPDEGNIFVQADYGQIEGRVAAVESRDEWLLGVFNDPTRDLFDEIGTGLYGSLEEAKKEEHRVRTKAYFYGGAYGREAYSIAAEYNLNVRNVEREMMQFWGQMPELAMWRDDVKHRAKQGGNKGLITHFGRRRRFWLITRDNVKDIEKEALAFIPQSTANDINLSALCRLRKDGLHIRIPVHDSIMAECPIEDAQEVGEHMAQVMSDTAREEYSDRVIWPVDIKTGHNWGELK